MGEIECIDEELEPIKQRLRELIDSLEFEYLCRLDEEDLIASQSYSGLYLIEVEAKDEYKKLESWISNFVNKWDLPEYKNKFTSTTKKKRIEKHRELKEWMPVYLGKSKNVGKRILEHINLPMDKPTFALKIKERGDMRQSSFRVSVIKLNVKNYQFIAPPLESWMRDRINPIVGKQ